MIDDGELDFVTRWEADAYSRDFTINSLYLGKLKSVRALFEHVSAEVFYAYYSFCHGRSGRNAVRLL